MRAAPHIRTLRGLLLCVTLLVAGAGPALALPAATGRQAPEPVYSPGRDAAADPGLVESDGAYYAFSTGGLAQVARARTAQGPWVSLPDALSRWGKWAAGTGAVWAPDAVRTEQGWVLYYSARAKGFAGQRCIGTAVSDHVAGPYEPADTPLICPILGGEDPVPGRPDPTSGVIDPSPFQAADGQRYLLYKTQKTPGTLRMVALTDDALHVSGPASRELLRHSDSIENPVMVQRGDTYVLFAAANWYDQCRYSTVWLRSDDKWSWTDKEEHVLMDQSSTGLCGPGGADLVVSDDRPTRMVLHAWVCGETDAPCQFEGVVTDPTKRRVMYAAAVTWGDDGATPRVAAFLPRAGAPTGLG